MWKLLIFMMLLPLPCYAQAVLKPSVASGFEALSRPHAIAADVELRSAQVAGDRVILQFKLADDPNILELELSAPHKSAQELDLTQFSLACDREAWRPHGAALNAIRAAVDRQFVASVWQQAQTDVKPTDPTDPTTLEPSEKKAAQLPFTWPQGPRGQWASILTLLIVSALTWFTLRQFVGRQRK